MRVTLVHPPNLQRSGEWKKQRVFRTPTNLAYLAAYIREFGHETCIIDFDVEPDTIDNMAARIMSGIPDVIGFTCLTPRFPAVIKIAEKCKEINADVITVVGGPHVTGLPQYVLASSAIDYGIIGEGEEALTELLGKLGCKASTEHTSNLIQRYDGKVNINPPRSFIADLDTLPFPAWDLLNLDKYIEPGVFIGPHVGIISARGCPHNCLFCASRVTWGRRVRLHSAENVVAELTELVNKFSISEFQFYDDTFTVNQRRTLAICDMIQEQNLNIRFEIETRADSLTLEMAMALKAAGCFVATIGVESGDDEILRQIGKNETKEDFREAVNILRKVGLPYRTTFIIGHPRDTHESIRATIDFAKELGADIPKFMIATPYPGSQLYQMAVERGILNEDGGDLSQFNYYQTVAANLTHVSDEDLKNYQQEAYDTYNIRRVDYELSKG